MKTHDTHVLYSFLADEDLEKMYKNINVRANEKCFHLKKMYGKLKGKQMKHIKSFFFETMKRACKFKQVNFL